MENVNNVHLVCRNLHQIANLHVNPKLRFSENSPKDLESLVQSSRIFEELEFVEGSDDYPSQGKFQVLEEYLGFTGIHTKKLVLTYVTVEPSILQKLLNLLPNLESLEVNDIKTANGEHETINWNFKSSKIERLKLAGFNGFPGFESLLKALEKCGKIKDLKLVYFWDKGEHLQLIHAFLQTQVKTLKKIRIQTNCFLPIIPNDLRLKSFGAFSIKDQLISFEFLKHQKDLEFLFIDTPNYSGLEAIFELKNLKTLILGGSTGDNSELNNIHKLEKLKELQVSQGVCSNILDCLKFGVFTNLESLKVHFEGASVESIQEMNQITPNLKKIIIPYAAPSDTINALLQALENLEDVLIDSRNWDSTEKIHPNIKSLNTGNFVRNEFNVEQYARMFPNLEYFQVQVSIEFTEPFFAKLFSELKRLKTLYMYIHLVSASDPELILECIQRYGKNLEEAKINFQSHDRKTNSPNFVVEKQSGGLFCWHSSIRSWDQPPIQI